MKVLLSNLPLYLFALLALTACQDFKPIIPPTEPIPYPNSVYSITEPANQSHSNLLMQTVSGSCTASAPLSLSGDFTGSPRAFTCSALGNFSESVTLTSMNGSKTIALVPQSPGPEDSPHSIVVNLDTVAPAAVTVTSPAANSAITQTSQTIQGACETGATVSLSGNIVTSPLTVTCTGGTYSRAVVLTSGDGAKPISIRQTDRAGNQSASINFSLNLSTTVPAPIVFTSPKEGAWLNILVPTVTGTCSGTNLVTLSLGGMNFSANCVSDAFSINVTLSGNDGLKNISGTQSNMGGASMARILSLNLDRTAPARPTVTSHTTGANVTAVLQTLEGACEANSTIIFSGDIQPVPYPPTCESSSTYSRPIVLTTGDGAKTVSIAQRDRANNISSARELVLNLNTIAPSAPTITSPAAGAYINSQSLSVNGTCATGNIVSVNGDISSAPRTTTCASNTYTISVTLNSGSGIRQLSVTQTNGGLTSMATTRSVNVDTLAPSAPTVTSHTSGSTVTATAQTIAGACESMATVTIGGSITPSPVTTACTSAGTYSRSVTLTSANGMKTLSITQTDLAANTSTARSLSLVLDIPTEVNPDWTPRNSINVLYSGHSLLDNPLPDYVQDIAGKRSDTYNHNYQNVIGSPIRVRTYGHNVPAWHGYRSGKTKSGSDNINFIDEVRNPQTIGAGQRYDTLVITENHSSLGQIQWENTIGYLRHYHDLMITGNSATRTFLYHSWLDINKASPAGWIQHEKNSEVTWECVVSKVNQSLQSAGRSDRLRLLPAGGALVYLVEQVLAGNVSGITGTNQQMMNTIFNDNVHMTQLGTYYLSLVVYASTYGKTPSGVAPPAASGVSSAMATQLQNIAWTYVNAYYNQGTNTSERSMSSCRSFISMNSCNTYWTLLGQTNNISSCTSLFGSGSNSDNPFRDAVLTPLPAQW